MNNFTFPQPGERTNSSAVPVPEETLGPLLVSAARDYSTHPCPFGGCSHCDAFVDHWWSAHKLLSNDHQDQVMVALQLEGLDYPQKV